jgi:hypothetical protein
MVNEECILRCVFLPAAAGSMTICQPEFIEGSQEPMIVEHLAQREAEAGETLVQA